MNRPLRVNYIYFQESTGKWVATGTGGVIMASHKGYYDLLEKVCGVKFPDRLSVEPKRKAKHYRKIREQRRARA